MGLCVANIPCPKCGGDKTPQRANSPTGVLRSPNRPNRAVRSYCLLGDGFCFLSVQNNNTAMTKKYNNSFAK